MVSLKHTVHADLHTLELGDALLNLVGSWATAAALIAAALWFLVEHQFTPKQAWSRVAHGARTACSLGIACFSSKVRLDPLEPLSFGYGWQRFRFPGTSDVYRSTTSSLRSAILLCWRGHSAVVPRFDKWLVLSS